MLALAFKSKGYEIEFIVDSSNKLNRPEFRYPHFLNNYPDWITDVSPHDLFSVSNPISVDKLDIIKKKFENCDVIFLNGFSIRFDKFFNKKHVSILTGSDLTNLADYKYAESLMELYFNQLVQMNKLPIGSKEFVFFKRHDRVFRVFKAFYKTFGLKIINDKSWFMPRNYIYNIFYLLCYKSWLYSEIEKQQNSIKNSVCYIYAPLGLIKDGDTLLKQIDADIKKRVLGLMVDESLAQYIPPFKGKIIRVFNVARFNWVLHKAIEKVDFSQLDMKGNDILIKGLGIFYRKHKTPLNIVFVKKGNDINETIGLLKQEGIDHLVTWKNELTQSEVYQEYINAHIVCDQFAQSVVSMGGLDAMAIGRPLIANARSEIYENVLGEKTQICDAKTSEEVSEWLEKLVFNEQFRIEKGLKSREFVMKHFSSRSVVNRLESYF